MPEFPKLYDVRNPWIMSSSRHKSCNVHLVEPALFLFYNSDATFIFSFAEEGKLGSQGSRYTGMLAITGQDLLIISDIYRMDSFDEKANYLGDTYTIDYQDADGSMYGMNIASIGDL
jgi:hypothetical protein